MSRRVNARIGRATPSSQPGDDAAAAGQASGSRARCVASWAAKMLPPETDVSVSTCDEDPELVQAAQRSEVEERGAIAAAGEAERRPLALLAGQELGLPVPRRANWCTTRSAAGSSW